MKALIPSVLLSLSLFALVPQALAVETDPSSFTCGEWDDVSSTYMDVMVDICDKGIMGGLGSNNFDGDSGISRAQAATVGNRIALGPNKYNSEDHSVGYYIDKVEDHFTDVPPNESWNEWVVKAMHYARLYGIMNGDGNDSGMTSFRYEDDVSTAEFLKILLLAGYRSHTLNDEDGSVIDYDNNPWYKDVVEAYDELGLLSDYKATGSESDYIEFKVHFDPESDTRTLTLRLNLNESITRQNVAFLIYEMMYLNIMDYPTSTSVAE